MSEIEKAASSSSQIEGEKEMEEEIPATEESEEGLDVVQIEEEEGSVELTIPGDKQKKFVKKVGKEMEQFQKAAAKSGLTGLTLQECVVGSMFASRFRTMPDPMSEVNMCMTKIEILPCNCCVPRM